MFGYVLATFGLFNTQVCCRFINILTLIGHLWSVWISYGLCILSQFKQILLTHLLLVHCGCISGWGGGNKVGDQCSEEGLFSSVIVSAKN